MNFQRSFSAASGTAVFTFGLLFSTYLVTTKSQGAFLCALIIAVWVGGNTYVACRSDE